MRPAMNPGFHGVLRLIIYYIPIGLYAAYRSIADILLLTMSPVAWLQDLSGYQFSGSITASRPHWNLSWYRLSCFIVFVFQQIRFVMCHQSRWHCYNE